MNKFRFCFPRTAQAVRGFCVCGQKNKYKHFVLLAKYAYLCLALFQRGGAICGMERAHVNQ